MRIRLNFSQKQWSFLSPEKDPEKYRINKERYVEWCLFVFHKVNSFHSFKDYLKFSPKDIEINPIHTKYLFKFLSNLDYLYIMPKEKEEVPEDEVWVNFKK